MFKSKTPIQLFLLVVASCIGLFFAVQYLRLLKPAQARSIDAACSGMRPSPTNSQLGKMAEGVVAKDFTLMDSEGNTVSLADYRGKIVIVNFWASWCSVCRSEKPSLEVFLREHPEVTVLAAASDKDWAPVRRALLGFEVSSVNDVLRQPQTYGVRNAEMLAASGTQLVISRIDGGRSAAKNGLRLLDRIVSVNGTEVESQADLDRLMRALKGNRMSLGVARKQLDNRQIDSKTVELQIDTSLRILLDPPDDDGNLGEVAKLYGITAVPESFVVDPEGNIRHYFINKRNWDSDVAVTCLQALVDE